MSNEYEEAVRQWLAMSDEERARVSALLAPLLGGTETQTRQVTLPDGSTAWEHRFEFPQDDETSS